jgi:hypothetical protein
LVVNRWKTIQRRVRISALASGAILATALLPATAGAAKAVSTNWAGYVTVPSAASGSRFSSVSGTWTQPAARCTAGRETYSAVWVGLGGYGESARALEQVGTDADCTRSGRAVYSAWFELLPAGSVKVALKVRPGQQLAASVTVRAQRVTLRIRNLSTGARFNTTRRASTVEVASAEWIVEAPSVCGTANGCRTLQLTDFGRAVFSSATATARRHTGTINDSGWTATELELQQGAYDIAEGASGPLASRLIVATPSSASSGSFAVSWHEQTIGAQAPPRPTLPGFSQGGP